MAEKRAKDPSAYNRYMRERRKRFPKGWDKKYDMKRRFGITIDIYNEMVVSQGGGCAICRGHNKSGKALAVDHNHTTGKVRGLLCSNCNIGIGNLRDSATLCRLAAEYLEVNGNE